MTKLFRITGLAALAAVIAAPCYAQGSAANTRVDGDVTIEASGTTQTAIAVGVAAKAENFNASTAAGTRVNGRFTAMTAVAGETAIAAGLGASATNQIASVTAGGTGGSAHLGAVTGQVTTLALGTGASACTSIASVNRPVGGSFGSVVGTGSVLNVGIGGLWAGHVTIGSTGPC